MPEPDWSAVAQAAYAAYLEVIDHTSCQNLPVPEWEELPPRHHAAWREAVKAAAELLAKDVRDVH